MAEGLRPWRGEDAPALLELYASTPDLERQLPELRGVADAIAYLAWATDPDRRVFAVTVHERVVGSVGVTHVDARHRTGWFSYWMSQDARGRGLTVRAAVTVADWALDQGGLFRLELGHRVNNPASGRVAEGAGFRVEGIERAKFEYEPGERLDVRAMSRLATDPVPPGKRITLADARPMTVA